jgi:hypothetical protein
MSPELTFLIACLWGLYKKSHNQLSEFIKQKLDKKIKETSLQ